MMKIARGTVDLRRATEGEQRMLGTRQKIKQRQWTEEDTRLFVQHKHHQTSHAQPGKNNEEGEEEKSANADPNELTNFGQRRVEKDYVLLKP